MVSDPLMPTADLMPRREPGLIERIFRAVIKADPGMGPQADQQASTQSGVLPQLMEQMFGQYFTTSKDRRAIYSDVDEMDDSAEEVSTALDLITNNVTTSEDGVQMSFEVESEDTAIKALLDKVVSDADLHKIVRPLVRQTVKFGDSFGEVVINGDFEIVKVRLLPSFSMVRNQDGKGNLALGKPQYDPETNKCLNAGGDCAFEQRTEDTRTVIAAFRPWQIVHTRLNWDGIDKYGKSHLRVTRIIWKKIHALEEALIIGRLTRAFLKLVFHIDTTGLDPKAKDKAVTTFREAILQRQKMDGRRENPFSVLTDIYLADGYVRTSDGKAQQSRSRVEMLDAKNEGMTNIDDIKYLHRKMLSTLRVPPAHLAFEEDVNAKATLGWQDVNYIRFIRDVQQLVGQSLEQIFDTALILAGYDPKTVDYEIKWPRLNANDEAADAKAEFDRAQADSLYSELGAIDAQWIQEHRFDMSEEEIADISGRVLEAQKADMAQQQAQADDAHAKALELTTVKAQVGAPQDSPKPTPGKVAAELTAEPVKNGGKGHAIRDEVTLLSEAIRNNAQGKLASDLDRILADQAKALKETREVAKAITAEKPTQLPLAAPPQPIAVHLHQDGATIVNDVRPSDVKPADVHVAAPNVEVTNQVPAVAPPDVQVHNEVKVPEQKPAQVTVKPAITVSAPDVKITNEVTSPDVHVAAPHVEVHVDQPEPGEVEIVRDDNNNVTGARRKPKRSE